MANIRYVSLKFKNGYSYRECSLPLDQQGLVLVRGLNVDDGGFLGAGKTSPFEVFASVQTGRVGKQRKGERHLADDIVNLSVGRDYEARLRVEMDGHAYDVVQTRLHQRHGNAFMVVDVETGRNILPNAARKHPQTWLSQHLLGIDEKSFFNLIYMAQDFSNAMLSGTDGDRQQSIVQMFGLDIYDELHRVVKLRLAGHAKVAKDVDALKLELQDLELQAKDFDKTVEELAVELINKRQNVLQTQEQHDAALNQSEQLQSLLRSLEAREQLAREAKRLWRDVDLPTVKRPKDVTLELCNEVQRKADAAADKAAQLRNLIRLLDRRSVIEQRLESITARDPEVVQKELGGVRAELIELNTTLPKAEQRAEVVADLRKLQRPTSSTEDLTTEQQELRDEQRRLEAEIKSVGSRLSKGVCPTCLRPIDMTDQEAKKLKKQQAGLRDRLAGVTAQLHDLASVLNNAKQYENLKQKLSVLGALADPLAIQKSIARLTQQERKLVTDLEGGQLRDTLKAQLAALPTESPEALSKRLQKYQEAADHYRRQYEIATSLLAILTRLRKHPKGDVDDVRKRLRRAHGVVRTKATTLVTLGSELADLERTTEQVKTVMARIIKIRKGLEESRKAQKEIVCLNALEYAFGSKGLKSDRFRAILRDATEQTVPIYSAALWPKRGAELSLVEDGAAVRVELTRGDLRTGSRLLSGGERNKAGLAMLFGMRDLKEKYTALQTNLLIVDEPFGNLDAFGTESLLRVLKRLKQRFSSIFVIGNQSDVLTSDVWDQTWWAVREDKTSILYRDSLPKRYQQLVSRYEAT